MQTIRTVLACLRNADQDYALIEDGDRIAIGVSGGKDSLCLLKALSIYGLFSHKRFKIVPVFLDLGFGNVNIEGVRNFVSSLGLELIVEDSTFVYPILKTHAKEGGHISCSICSRSLRFMSPLSRYDERRANLSLKFSSAREMP